MTNEQRNRLKKFKKIHRKIEREKQLRLLALSFEEPLLVNLPLFLKFRNNNPESRIEQITRYLERIEDNVNLRNIKKENPGHWQYTFKSYDGMPALTGFSLAPTVFQKLWEEQPMTSPQEKIYKINLKRC